MPQISHIIANRTGPDTHTSGSRHLPGILLEGADAAAYTHHKIIIPIRSHGNILYAGKMLIKNIGMTMMLVHLCIL
jgi:hypothetical protein